MSSSAVGPVPRVLVVDPDARTRESLTGLLAIGGRVEVAGSAGDALTALALAGSLEPDVVLVDPRLPDLEGGHALVSRIRELVPDCRIVVLNGAAAVPQGWSAGDADAFVRKTFRPSELLEAVFGPAADASS